MSEIYVAQHRPAIQVVPGPDRTILVGAGCRIRVDRHDSLFAAAVVADLVEIEDLPSGPEALRHSDGLGAPIMIRKPEVKPEPQNGWVHLDTASGGAVIVYDPFDWPQKPSRTLPSSPEVLLTLLRHANTYAAERAVSRTAAEPVS